VEEQSELAELAAAYGIAIDYWDWQGRHVNVSTKTIAAVLAALDVDVSTPEAAQAELEQVRLVAWRRMLPPCVVTTRAAYVDVLVHVAAGAGLEVWAELEDGTVRRDLAQQHHLVPAGRVDAALIGEAKFRVPAGLPAGYHRLLARSGDRTAEVPLIVTPDRLEPPTVRTWGFTTQLYSVRSSRSWGIGDLGDLAELAAWSGSDLGAGFVLINPLNAAGPTLPVEPSPYLPTTRRYFDPLYLDLNQAPELAALEPADRERIEQLAVPLRQLNYSPDLLDRDRIWPAKLRALEILRAAPRSAEREASYQSFLEKEGDALLGFGTWCVLSEKYGAELADWPEHLRRPDSPKLEAFQVTHAERIDLFRYAQWLLDEQLDHAQRQAKDAGMTFGVVHDLPVGVHPHGADAWALQDVLAQGIAVGAPPDEFNQQGQNWSQPPWRPDRLAETGYAVWRDLCARAFRHAGGVRVDHAIGMFRLWWVPDGGPADEGTYVRYDHEAMVGILLLEAERAGAVVIGEDLGTVEPWSRSLLHDRGILGTSVLWFERGEDGRPRPPEEWRELCLATVTVHDLPPTQAYLAGAHVKLRDELGLLTRPVAVEQAAFVAERETWERTLREYGLLAAAGAGDDPGDDPGDDGADEAILLALHRFVAKTPSVLIGPALTDAVGDPRIQNQPGTHFEYPNWQFPLCDASGRPVLLDDLPDLARLRRLVRALSVPCST
jgi:4-alpha-glucanotransferase